MSLFTKLGETISGSSDDAESSNDEDVEDSAESIEQTGPNFMPSKQKELYLKAFANASDLSATGVCSECGTTLSPFKAERLFASCKNENCENYLREKEVIAVKRYEDRHGVPDEVDVDEDPMAAKGNDQESGSALDGLSDAMDDDS
ncbi:hypothetical protein [Salinarchaeum laminariae]|uniref:hypothetical protein n=1 Tax=Salinarchaeum laminariae TaxID=869888 RepID=UPI0020BE549F|nr:hypothetical protein [Salinarchaeum laminariae]